ncbi:DUF262 domain-containing protein [Treponema phagedenis]|uniref:DUF4357 domain-containing protein n=1 Tax=Treponema phagedenis TaxID=162 RepID=UPI0011EF77A2|nr:DUF4357 domain-containing protein [Treponema phagedenis]QSH99384.1 DUF262 domain-containing protein [Treponema phagedenis]TYT77780.1 DUF4357 domain-containing protein [Treponema phagedenis]
MSSKITGKEYPLKEIFSKEFEYHIPAYQRPYAWTEEETGTLFDDLYDFFQNEQEDNYFLGSIVLIKEDGIPDAEVIDGQQRLTTLTILIAVIASYLTGDNKSNCNNYLREPGNDLEGLKPLPRLHLRKKDQDFFNKYIQNGNLSELILLYAATITTESQKHIQANCSLLIKKMDGAFDKDETKVTEFCRFLITRCYLVAVCTPTQQSAFRVFSVMNSRGLNLMPVDIIKSDVIGKIPEDEQQFYTDKWEDLEVQTTRSGFNDVFTHTRMIFAKSKPKRNLLDEYRKYVLEKISPKELINNILEPYVDTYIILVNRAYEATKNADEINQYLFWLNKIDNSDWMPVAIKFIAIHKNDSDYILWFIKKLERLAAFLHITAKDINRRIDRYKKILEEMENRPDHNINMPLSSIEITDADKKEFVETLNGEIYLLTGIRRNFVILRLNTLVSDGANKFDFEPNILTIEHVLPQTVAPNSEWERTWPNISDREYWLNRIANLVPLTRKKNSQAQNYDFKTKKTIYFTGKNGTTTYPLTTQVVHKNEWTPEIVEARQNELINKFITFWELQYTKSTDNVDIVQKDTFLFYIVDKREANAIGNPDREGFVVKKDSKLSDDISKNLEKKYPRAFKLRAKLIKEKIVIDGVFQKDYKFNSISLAASVILGRNASGQKEWADADGIVYEKK